MIILNTNYLIIKASKMINNKTILKKQEVLYQIIIINYVLKQIICQVLLHKKNSFKLYHQNL